MFKSWETTLSGILSIVAGLWYGNLEYALDNNPETVVDWGVIIFAVLVGTGLIRSMDNNVSSEEVGANKPVSN